MARRIVAICRLAAEDFIILNNYKIGVDVLHALINPDARLLWAFIKKDDRIQAVAYDEAHCIWLEPSDLEHPVEV